MAADGEGAFMLQKEIAKHGVLPHVLEGEYKRQILVVTGVSGSGKSSVLRSLEDLGFYCVDNLPTPLLPTFLTFTLKNPSGLMKVALGIDARGGNLRDVSRELEQLKNSDAYDLKVVFLNADDATIIKRFQETRRAHPLGRGISLNAAIKKERTMLSSIESIADQVHYTDKSNPHELRKWVRDTFAGCSVRELVVNVISFGFKYGVPIESNVVYDLRFLPNPYFVPSLKHLTGKDGAIQDYLFEKDEVKRYWGKLYDFLSYLLQCYYEEGRFFANISIGCTGGKHRSVAFVEKLCAQAWPHMKFVSYHRDIGKE